MGRRERAAAAVQPWLDLAAKARRTPLAVRRRERTADQWVAAKDRTLGRAEAVLRRLAEGECAVDSKFPVPRTPDSLGDRAPPGYVPKGLAADADEAIAYRDAVLRLGVWGALDHWFACACGPQRDASLHGLVRAMSLDPSPVPPGLQAAAAFEASSAAVDFFGKQVLGVLTQAAAVFDSSGCAFDRLARQLPNWGEPGALPAWSHAWSVGTAIVYADSLLRTHGGRVQDVQTLLWKDVSTGRPPNFRSHGTIMPALPTARSEIRLRLWLPVVLAQLMRYEPSRWDDAQAQWHPVDFWFHDLNNSVCGSMDTNGYRIRKGIAVGMLYQAVFMHRANSACLMPAEPMVTR